MQVFLGNHDQNTWKRHCLHRYYGFAPVARYVRLVVTSSTQRCVGLRFELYGFRAADDPQLLDGQSPL